MTAAKNKIARARKNNPSRTPRVAHFVYILRCADDTLYVGSTNDLEKRVHQHNHAKSGAHYTKIRRPVELAWSESVSSLAVARAREAELKRLTRAEKLEIIA